MMTYNEYVNNAKDKFLAIISEYNKKLDLDPNDFDITLPEFADEVDCDTKIFLKPRLHSPYHGEPPVYFKRTDLDGEVYRIELAAYRSTLDLLPALNLRFGLSLTEHDVYNETLIRSPDPYTLQEHSIKIRPDSYHYKGIFSVKTGVDYHIPKNPLNIYLFLNIDNVDFVKESVIRLDKKGVIDKSFNFLSNVLDKDILEYRLDKVIKTVNDFFYLIGDFKLTEYSAYYGTTIERDFKTLIVDTAGFLIRGEEAPLFEHLEGNYYNLIRSQFRYFIKDNTLKRYKDSGLIDSKYKTKLEGELLFFRTNKKGKLFVVTHREDGYYVNRLSKNGVVEKGYEIKIADDGVTGVSDISVDDIDRLYLLFSTKQTYDAKDTTPLINGKMYDESTSTRVHAWNPLIRFTSEGEVDETFAKLLYTHHPNSIHETNSTTSIGSRGSIAVNDRGIALLTTKTDGFSGFRFNQPISFRLDGYPQPLLINPIDLPKWVEVTAQLNADDFNLVYGRYQPYTYDEPKTGVRNLLWRYDIDGNTDFLWFGDVEINEVFVVNE